MLMTYCLCLLWLSAVTANPNRGMEEDILAPLRRWQEGLAIAKVRVCVYVQPSG